MAGDGIGFGIAAAGRHARQVESLVLEDGGQFMPGNAPVPPGRLHARVDMGDADGNTVPDIGQEIDNGPEAAKAAGIGRGHGKNGGGRRLAAQTRQDIAIAERQKTAPDPPPRGVRGSGRRFPPGKRDWRDSSPG